MQNRDDYFAGSGDIATLDLEQALMGEGLGHL